MKKPGLKTNALYVLDGNNFCIYLKPKVLKDKNEFACSLIHEFGHLLCDLVGFDLGKEKEEEFCQYLEEALKKFLKIG